MSIENERFCSNGPVWTSISGTRGRTTQTILRVGNQDNRSFLWYEKWADVSFITMDAFDRQTDRQTEMPGQYRALHYMQSHAKK